MLFLLDAHYFLLWNLGLELSLHSCAEVLWRPFGILGTSLVAPVVEIHGPRYLFLVSKPPDFVISSI